MASAALAHTLLAFVLYVASYSHMALAIRVVRQATDRDIGQERLPRHAELVSSKNKLPRHIARQHRDFGDERLPSRTIAQEITPNSTIMHAEPTSLKADDPNTSALPQVQLHKEAPRVDATPAALGFRSAAVLFARVQNVDIVGAVTKFGKEMLEAWKKAPFQVSVLSIIAMITLFNMGLFVYLGLWSCCLRGRRAKAVKFERKSSQRERSSSPRGRHGDDAGPSIRKAVSFDPRMRRGDAGPIDASHSAPVGAQMGKSQTVGSKRRQDSSRSRLAPAS